MATFFFQWTDEIIEHIGQNGISPEDFETVVNHPEDKGFSRTTERPLVFGRTADGRFIVAIFEMLDDDTVIPVTAYEVPERAKKHGKQRKKRKG